MKRIRTKMMVGILPFIVLGMIILTVISVVSSSNIIDEQISTRMTAELESNMNSIDGSLEVVRTTAMNISQMVSSTYKQTDLKTYEKMLGELIQQNDLVLGSGIWFEPFVYDAQEKYVGPYIYKDGSSIAVTYDYSNAEYDYLNQEYYTMVAGGATSAMITDPYYDPTADTIMASCSAPIYDNGKFIGCITVDIELTSMEEVVSSIQIGKTGNAVLTTGDGTYMSCEDPSKVASAMNITQEGNASLASAGSMVLNSEEGVTSYKDGKEMYHLFYDTIPEVNWKLMIRMTESELNQPVITLVIKLVLVCVVALIFCIIAVLLLVSSISNSVNHVNRFAGALASGDFTVASLETKSKDELGAMGRSLNDMYDKNKEVIQNISVKADSITASSNVLNESVNDLLGNFEQIHSYMGEINEAMMTSSAATEEVNASVEEVNASINVLATETDKSKDKVMEIKQRASEIEISSRKSYENATALSGKHEEELAVAIENGKVVENIGEMAHAISGIAEQINLLSLNASIEAARAGEQGKGFAVVATEIGKLANDTSTTVSEIEETISAVRQAFSSLSGGTSSILKFLNETVTPDYDKFVSIAKQYGEDADSFEAISEKISEMTESIASTMSEVSDAVQNVADSAQSTADLSTRITGAVETVSDIVENVSNMAGEQEQIAMDLGQVVSNFKL